ncbi:hypothetical protein RFI_03250 [Reticulomyxa filosa]|uniref:Uncharacterized protein n=1 Tax=Reticulomyxa filosa TaxID=46433 RepID=X6P6P3_RETFI|nr:hypothetical protein RFI_03250 [Reticulomyxa filosa]|eukprot:ETO33846.1 hypothetical protein RFI_03250 [Reticulomyxa filosa]
MTIEGSTNKGWRLSKLNNQKMLNNRKQAEEVLDLVDIYKKTGKHLHINLNDVMNEMNSYIKQYVLEKRLKQYEDLKMESISWDAIEVYTDDINKKLSVDSQISVSLYSFLQIRAITEETLYQLPILEQILKANNELKQRGSVNEGCLRESTANGLEKLKAFIQNPTFIELRPEFHDYKQLVATYAKLKQYKINIEQFHTNYTKLLLIASDVSELQNDNLYPEKAFKFLYEVAAILGISRKYFPNEGLKADETASQTKYDLLFRWMDALFPSKTNNNQQAFGQNMEAGTSKDILGDFQNIDSKIVRDKINEKFQMAAKALVDIGKATCFAKVLQIHKDASNCMIERPAAAVDDGEYKNKCISIYKTVDIAMENCMNIFPMETIHDDLIQELIDNVSSIQVEILHDDTSSFNFHSHTYYQRFDLLVERDETEDASKFKNPTDILKEACYSGSNAIEIADE